LTEKAILLLSLSGLGILSGLSILASLGTLGVLGILGSWGSLGDTLDDTDGNGLSHITNGKTTEWWVVREGLNAHWLGWNESDDSSITRLDVLGLLFELLSGTSVNLGFNLLELAGNVGSVAIQDWGVTVVDLSGVVKDDDLGGEVSGFDWWVVLGVTSNVTTTNILDRDVLDVESNVVSGDGFEQSGVMHLNRLNFSGKIGGSEGDDGSWLEDTGLNSADWHCANTSDLVDILEWDTEWLVDGSLWWFDGVEGFKEGWALVPWEVGRLLQHVVSEPSRDWDEWNLVGVVSDLLDVGRDFLLDFFVTWLSPVDGFVVHLVDNDDHLLDTKGEGEESVLTGLSVLGDTGFELSLSGGNDEDGTIGLGGTSDHVLDKVTMSGGINDGEVVLWRFELPESNIDGNTTLTFSLELIEHPGVLEGTLSHLLGFLFELLDGSLIDTTAFVDKMASGGGLSRVDVTNDDKVNVDLFLSHVCCIKTSLLW
jgi:hypothetical protein